MSRLMSSGHGRREEEHLLLLGQAVEDARHFLVEALVEHLVGFVEHRVHALVELQIAAADVVVNAAGGADHDGGAAAQRVFLLRHR